MNSLETKLGLKQGLQAFTIHNPSEIALPAKSIANPVDIPGNVDWILAFYKDKNDLLSDLNQLAQKLNKEGQLWLSWPKKASGVMTDLSDVIVREAGLNAGLVDVKIASVNEVWSGIKFVYRLVDRKVAP